jgi:hypothetical protein
MVKETFLRVFLVRNVVGPIGMRAMAERRREGVKRGNRNKNERIKT